ncbi:hypothetical protein JCM3766R1_005824, partial [Sporobolomyces carnicolor]
MHRPPRLDVEEGSPLLVSSDPTTTRSYFPPPSGHDQEDSERRRSSSSSSPTSRRRRKLLFRRCVQGFYLYSIASEVWIISTGTLFLPVALETYARHRGRLGPEYLEPCPPSTSTSSDESARCRVRILFAWVDTASFSLIVYSISVLCQALTVISIGTLADDPKWRHRLLLAFAAVGSIASFSFVFLSPDFVLWWPFAAMCAIVANVSFGATTVFLNSNRNDEEEGLDAGSAGSADEDEDEDEDEDDDDDDDDEKGLRRALRDAQDRYTTTRSRVTSRISSRAIAIGYGAGIVVLCALLPLVSHLQRLERERGAHNTDDTTTTSRSIDDEIEEGGTVDDTWPLRVAIGTSAVWWVSTSFIASRFLNPKASTAIRSSSTIKTAMAAPFGEADDRSDFDSMERGEEEEESSGGGEEDREDDDDERTAARHGSARGESTILSIVLSNVGRSWRGLGDTLREWRRLPNTFVFLSAWFLLSDSYATLTSTAMLFAKTTLNVPTSSLIAVAILTPLSGILGSLVFPLLESRHVVDSIIRKIQSFKSGSSSLATSASSSSSSSSSSTVDSRRRRRPSNPLSILILLVTLSTSIPIWGLTRLTSRQELYALACVFGMLYGSFQAYSRTAFATVIPRSQAGRWFGLYSITDKSSSFLGPLLVSIITNETGQ